MSIMASSRHDPEGDLSGTYPGSGYNAEAPVTPITLLGASEQGRLPQHYIDVGRIGLASARAALEESIVRHHSSHS